MGHPTAPHVFPTYISETRGSVSYITESKSFRFVHSTWPCLPDLERRYGTERMHFITCSCYRRMPLLNDDRIKQTFLAVLEETRQKYGFRVHGYVIMPEHFHLLISEPETGDPGTVMQVLKQTSESSMVEDSLPHPFPNDGKGWATRSHENDSVTPTPSPHPFANDAKGWGTQDSTVLADAFLRFQCVESRQEGREAKVHAPQSGKARLGGTPRRLALEQLPALCAGRNRSRRNRVGVDSTQAGTRSPRLAASFSVTLFPTLSCSSSEQMRESIMSARSFPEVNSNPDP